MPQLDGVVGVSQTTLDVVRDFYHLTVPMRTSPPPSIPSALEPTQLRLVLRAALGHPPMTPASSSPSPASPSKSDPTASCLPPCRPRRRTSRTSIPDSSATALCAPSSTPRPAPSACAHAVHFLGAQEHVGDYLNAADLFALTSDTEGMPGVLLEAGYMGLPVVATDVGGVAECVVDGETGILVAAHATAVTALTAALARLLRDAGLRAKFGRCAQAWVGNKFTIDRVAAAYVDFYTMLFAASSAPHNDTP